MALTPANNDNDHTLTTSVANGNIKGFEVLFMRHYTVVYKFVLGMVKDTWLAEDIAQNVFMKVWLYRSGLRADTDIKNYIFVIARNEVNDYFRLRRVHTPLPETSPPAELMDEVESRYSAGQIRELVDNLVERMPEQRRRVFRMSRAEQLSNNEISEKLGISVRTVNKHLELALREIRRHLDAFSVILFLLFLG